MKFLKFALIAIVVGAFVTMALHFIGLEPGAAGGAGGATGVILFFGLLRKSNKEQ